MSGPVRETTTISRAPSRAKAIGSVNTLVRRGGKLYGYNTDIDGFLYMLRRARIWFQPDAWRSRLVRPGL